MTMGALDLAATSLQSDFQYFIAFYFHDGPLLFCVVVRFYGDFRSFWPRATETSIKLR